MSVELQPHSESQIVTNFKQKNSSRTISVALPCTDTYVSTLYSESGASRNSIAVRDIGAFVAGQSVYIAGQADGVLAGLKFAVKDLFDVKGVPTGGVS